MRSDLEAERVKLREVNVSVNLIGVDGGRKGRRTIHWKAERVEESIRFGEISVREETNGKRKKKERRPAKKTKINSRWF